MQEKLKWAVIGGGNGGQSISGHLGLMGFPVRLYDIFPDTVEAVNKQGGIEISGAVQGFGKVELATGDIGEAVDGADIIMVVAPALAHQAIARNCAPHLKDGQIILLHPGATFGALEFSKVIKDEECKANITIAEANSLLYACRSPKPGYASIFGIKNNLMIAALPAVESKNVVKMLNTAFPQMYAAENVFATSLGNANAMMHPGPTLLNTSMIESGRQWKYYWDGITPSVGAFVEAMDKERVALGKAFGIELTPILALYKELYGTDAETLCEAVRQNQAYSEIEGQKTLRTRYILEDIPMGLVPMISLGKQAGTDVSMMETVVKMGEFLMGEDLTAGGRTLENLGLSQMSSDDIRQYVETGRN
ncbi:MAG: NADP transhydrogenase subunit alpha [Desulfobacterales bacterium]|nr:NADP transhydrogenase subunit alpha [Desulfobacterales bacterium]